MKSTLKIALVIAMFSTVSFADGDMTSGGRSCEGTCLTGGQPTVITTIDTTANDSDILFTVKSFLSRIFW
ncbi:MAG: hypothetical protein KIS76_16895 [Pyrinomonadaceae bacterium]|nr:hypothetical protein [Pyrinomonadaceae bacterium]